MMVYDFGTTMAGRDPSHWLHRLDADEWLRAADNELERARRALEAKQQRPGVAGARRAAGMAWNAVLVGAENESYGRSYMDHLQALVRDERVPEAVRAAAQQLLAAPLATNVVALGKGDTRHADAARLIVDEARRRIKAS
jgi:HEPN domain-containing protein